MKQSLRVFSIVAALVAALVVARAAAGVVIYFIDVEGGQATLVVTPAGESLLVDAGFPSDDALIAPAFGARPGGSANGRDPKRIVAAAEDAGIKQIDYLMLTHFHADHDGGVVELSRMLPIRAFVDKGAPAPGTDENVPGSQAIYEQYLPVRAGGRHIVTRPGDVLPLKGVEAKVVSAGGQLLSRPLAGAGQTNPVCSGTGVPAQEKTENPNSVGILLRYGRFRFLDVGDLSGDPLFALACPQNLVGEVDVYLIAHHGGADAADPALFRAINPLVAIFNNGPRKGAQAPTLATIRQMPSIDAWQLHRTLNPGAENAAEDRIANLDESTSAWIKITANEDGSFSVSNGRNGYSKTYRR